MSRNKIITEPFATPECTLYSHVLGIDWNYSIYLPGSYNDGTGKEYPVIYFLHGAYGNHRNIIERTGIGEKLRSFAEEGLLPEVIAVFVDGFNSFYIDGPTMKVETAIIKDLIPQIETMYRVRKEKSARTIGGLSMGGFGSARFAVKYPELFNAAILLSPAVYRSSDEDALLGGFWHTFARDGKDFSQEYFESEHPKAFLKSYREKNSPVKFYVSTGDADKSVPVEEVRWFVSELEKVAAVEYVEVPGEVHSWTFWTKGFEDGLKAVFA